MQKNREKNLVLGVVSVKITALKNISASVITTAMQVALSTVSKYSKYSFLFTFSSTRAGLLVFSIVILLKYGFSAFVK